MLEQELENGWCLFQQDGLLHYFARSERYGITGGKVTLDKLKQLVPRLEDRGFDIYVHANETSTRRPKARRNHIVLWRYTVLDLDPIQPTVSPEQAIAGLILCAGRLGTIPDSSYAVAFTGRGAQAWARNSGVRIVDREHAITIERAQNAFLHKLSREWGLRYGYDVDTTPSDLPRVVRLLGTKNTRTGEYARILRPLETGGSLASPDDILSHAPPPEEYVIEPYRGSLNLQDVSLHLNDKAASFLTSGSLVNDRHNAAYAAAKALAELGIPIEVAEAWVIEGGQRCLPSKLHPEEAKRACHNAYRRHHEQQ